MTTKTELFTHSFNKELTRLLEERKFPLLLKFEDLQTIDIQCFELTRISYEQKSVQNIYGYETVTFHMTFNHDDILIDYVMCIDENHVGDYQEGFYINNSYYFDQGYEYVDSRIVSEELKPEENIAFLVLNELMTGFIDDNIDDLQDSKNEYEYNLASQALLKLKTKFPNLVDVSGFSEQYIQLKFENGVTLEVTHDSIMKLL
ncbi:hypothetical protein [Bacillus thuringiensis]|uniref:Uncharacterized protein n=1 Tax=Bacillus thuringiensis TaxID=1428 RepID=A0A9X6WJE7_BACTU|nr:hypothetical protein [Bacillus thuringiensis]PFJ32327.1 hypothetical protein COJ15_29090 [Bacillus thuringiensis]